MKQFLIFLCFTTHIAQSQPEYYQIKTSKIFDGKKIQSNASILIHNNTIIYLGPESNLPLTSPGETEVIDLTDYMVLPGLIEGHSHLLLHPYNETSWTDQVLRESLTERVARATVSAKKTLLAGFTTVRELGTEGAGYSDVGLKTAINKGIIPGPRIIASTRAIVAFGSYGPKGFRPDAEIPLGAEVADGYDDLIKTVRDQIGKGADFIKVYADYRWGVDGKAMPTFSLEELK